MKRMMTTAAAGAILLAIGACAASTSTTTTGGETTTSTTSAAVNPVRSQTAAQPVQRGGKNLRVLPKDIPRPELIATMRRFNRSLGVKCDFCHVPAGKELDFPSDANPHKNIARSMIRMTQSINANFISKLSTESDDRVTCYTCHRGEKHPLNVLPPPREGQPQR